MNNNGAPPNIIFFLGAPGAGKGTQISLLSDKLGFTRVETSGLLQNKFNQVSKGETVEIEGKEYSWDQQKERFETGLLVEPEVVVYTLVKKLKKLAQDGESIIVDGFPRSIGQVEKAMPFISEVFNKDRIVVVYIDIDEDAAVLRNSNRRICELARHPVLYIPETKNLTVCPLDGSNLVKRVDDNSDIIRKRVKVFHEETLPVIDYFNSQEIKVHTIDGKHSVADVFEKIQTKLKESLLK